MQVTTIGLDSLTVRLLRSNHREVGEEHISGPRDIGRRSGCVQSSFAKGAGLIIL